MKIEHIAIYVKNLEQAKWFFEYYFGGKSNAGYHNTSSDFRSYFLTFEDGSRLELMNKPGLTNPNIKSISDENADIPAFYGYAHLAFSVGSKERVDQITRQLKEAGYRIISGPRTTGDGYYESCIAAFEGNLIEVTI